VRVLGTSVLIFEAIVVGLAIPAALALTDVDPALVGWWFGGAALAGVVIAGLLRYRVGYLLGSLLQVAVIAAGFVLPAMFFMGALFALLWALALYFGHKAETVRAATGG
jgi:hypothetical protein